MTAEYSKYSAYADTQRFGRFLDTMTFRNVPKSNLDNLITISASYAYRPDLLAADLYGASQLWWVFAARNPNVIQDPIFDFLPGKTIYVPQSQSLMSALGL